MSKFLTGKLKALKPYTPGEQPKEREYIKLNTNESPFPPSAKAVEYAECEARRLMLYSDPECKELAKTLSESLGVKPSEVILTNGSDEVLNFAFMAYCDESCPAVFANITYGFYKVFAAVNNVPFCEIPLKDDFTIDVDDYVNSHGTVFIANPNAPTGIALGIEKLEKIISSNRDRIVVIDEAYVDFGAESCIPLIRKYDNLLVTGTFSKSRSMAGARLGFGVASEKLIEDLTRIRYSTNPYNVNRMTAAAGVGALLDDAYFKDNCKKIIENREWTKGKLKGLGFEFTDSKANFVFAKHKKIGGKELYEKLKAKGVLIRHFEADKISDYNRITVGSIEEMKTLVDKIKEMLGE
ncbi:MAG: histidinol-phosphate transaminase [Clostridia bacterium]|nr:histidinol-phosphate transaminase [Clostridia bacterium]